VLKYDAELNILWQYDYTPERGFSEGTAIVHSRTADEYVVGGFYRSFEEPIFFQKILIKLDASGNRVWEQTIGNSSQNTSTYYNELCQLQNGNWVLASYVDHGDNFGWAGCVSDGPGTLVWHRSYERHYEFKYIVALQDGNLVVFGEHPSSHIFAMKLNANNGGLIWYSNIYVRNGNGQEIEPFAAVERENGNLLFTGYYYLHGAFNFVAETSPTGVILSDTTFGDRQFRELWRTDEGDIIATGTRSGATVFVTKFCSSSAPDHGVLKSVHQNDSIGGYRIEHQSGAIYSLVFRNFAVGTVGSVTGNAAASWSVVENGDGNDGDSIIFNSLTPLETGSLDTFWLTRPDARCTVEYTIGCKEDTARISNSLFEIDEFWAGHVDPNAEFRIRTNQDVGVERYEIWSRSSYSAYVHRASIMSRNSDHPEEYVTSLPYEHLNEYRLRVVDVNGCVSDLHPMDWRESPISVMFVGTEEGTLDVQTATQFFG